ncbi:MAG: Peptide-N(4)-(N-acetyl-beta-glucosaminyl)asparagine amidase [Trebouxia sp. A1-2]|nr:MAG: Peptide-N(4)-(N-acetyl-beta-glucosaminyl)asparagine amidase [Trebouxia sp. A1-2]
MDLDAALARQLQYEDELLQAISQSVMPLDCLVGSANSAAALSVSMGEQPARQAEDLLAQELLTWFKHDFFTWVNSPPCSHCGSSDMHASGMAVPTAEEADGNAGRVELHTCRACSCTTRFPRYNHPAKLLETRQGRCGEWANCFTLCCRAAGLEARYILDWTDHVWTEYYSHAHRRWIHMDPCEAAYDKPLLYEAGWGKQLSYVVAFSRHGVTDVMKRYTKQWDQLKQRRTLVTEDWLQHQCATLTANHRRGWTAEEKAEWEQLDRLEQAELADHAKAPTTLQEHTLPGRQTGSEGWRAARGELGNPPSSSSSSFAANATAFRMADDDSVQSSKPGRLCGGVVRASGEHTPHQTAVRAFDGGLQDKWLDFGGANGGVTWLEYRLLPAQPAAAVIRYSLTAAEDEPNRDPCDFELEGSLECPAASGTAIWRQLDKQAGVMFPSRHHTHTFALQHPKPCRSYRLRITAVRDPASANSVQLAKLDLYTLLDPPCQSQRPISEAVTALQAAVSKAAGSKPDSAMAKAVDTLLLVLANILQHPGDSKFRSLKLENVKIKAMMLAASEVGQVLKAAGFEETRLPRQGKQPPELALTLDNSETATSNVFHTLTLLQSPHSMHNPAPATLSQGQRQQSAIQLQKHVSQGNTPAQELQGPEPLGNGEGELSPDDMQLTDDTATPDMPAEVETAADAGAGAEAAAVLETPVAHSDAGQVPESQPVAQGSLQASQQATHDTPTAQAVTHTPSAPQRQAKYNASASALTQLHKLQLQSPSTEGTQGVTTPAAAARQAGNSTESQSAYVAAGQLDAKTLIHQEFARLMTTKQYTPNEAAVLAIQNVRTQQ